MTDFGRYLAAQAESRAATAQYDHAVEALKNAKIMERLAEIKSQHEPIASLLDERLSKREQMYAAAYYVVTGRNPTLGTIWPIEGNKPETKP